MGAGFGGLELTARLSEEFGADVDVVLIDKSDDFVFGFSKLEVLFGRARPDEVRHPYRDLVKPGVQFVQSTIRAIDPNTKRVETAPRPSMPTSSSLRLAPICTRRRRPAHSSDTRVIRAQSHRIILATSVLELPIISAGPLP